MQDHQCILVPTGASRGIGRATVECFAAAGWRVLAFSRHPFPAECPWLGGERDHVRLDLGDPARLPAAITAPRARLPEGKLDALGNSAAISPKGAGGSRLGGLESEHALWAAVFDGGLFSTALLARGLFAQSRVARGAVVNVTSIAGSRVHPFAGVAYAASEAALAALTREMAHDFGPHGVRVNAIAPGRSRPPPPRRAPRRWPSGPSPLRRLGRPEEVTDTIHVLCTRAGYVNGAEVHIDGGWHV